MMNAELIPHTETVFASHYYRRFFHGSVAALTVWDADAMEFVTINAPEAVFYNTTGEYMTVKGLRGTSTTRKFYNQESCIVSVYFTDGTALHAQDNTSHVDL